MIEPIAQSSLRGLQKNLQSIHESAVQISQQGTKTAFDADKLLVHLHEIATNRRYAEANLQVLRTANEISGTLLDVHV